MSLSWPAGWVLTPMTGVGIKTKQKQEGPEMNNSRAVFKPGWLLLLAVISIAFIALALGAATSNTAEAQAGGPGNGGRGGGGHDLGAWEHCIATIDGNSNGAVAAALAKLNAREAGGHHYTLVEVIACGIHSKSEKCPGDDTLYAFRFIVDDDLRGVTKRVEKNVKVCHPDI